ncbi:protein CUSTOS isoform X3 [Microcebus murinus]|uniref:protein CUSTOS isoform X3 n=1 Tax=Microcebus murinus TaxID=30608 RepID=UPI003F6C3D5C
MAALNGAMRDSDNSSSSSDAEELARCREAAMPAWGLEQRPRGPEEPRAGTARNQLAASHPSLRLKVDEHEQDGNELQTTPEFRAHVAKKLGALLDSIITISEAVKEPRKAEVQKVTSEDDAARTATRSGGAAGRQPCRHPTSYRSPPCMAPSWWRRRREGKRRKRKPRRWPVWTPLQPPRPAPPAGPRAGSRKRSQASSTGTTCHLGPKRRKGRKR